MTNSPNVLFLVVDSLRADVVVDNESYRTPVLDRLIHEGIVFTNCYAQGISTAPSMTAMLTGRYPLEYGGHWHLEENQPTFAEQFQRGGYTTGAFHSNPYVSSRRNFDRGFDTFEEDVVTFEPDGALESAPQKVLRLLNRLSRIVSRTPYTPASEVNDQLKSWTARTEQPWFLWTQYMDVHGPYLPGDDFTYWNKFRAEWIWRKAAVNAPEQISDAEHKELKRNYRKEVEYLDEEVGNLLDTLEERSKLDETIVVVVGDHGDAFNEHGDYGHSNLPYDELIHVPLIIRFPDDAPFEQGQQIEDIVRCIDILPTILDYVDVELEEEMERRMAGESLLPTIKHDESPDFDYCVTEKRIRGEDALRIGLRTERWKFLYDGKSEETFLYDLQVDPDEQKDVSGEHEEVVEEFTDKLQARLKRIEKTSGSVTIPDLDTDAGVEERLRALGYRE